MRRLAVLAVLLVCPAVAQADGISPQPPPTFVFRGCSNPIAGCIDGKIEPFPDRDPFSTTEWLYSWTATCANCTPETFGPVRLYLYDANADEIYRYRTGDFLGGRELNEVPAFGLLEFVGPDNPGLIPVAVSTTPEPGTMALLGSGLVALAGMARRRRRVESSL